MNILSHNFLPRSKNTRRHLLFRPQKTNNAKMFRELPVHIFWRQKNKIKNIQVQSEIFIEKDRFLTIQIV